jgi:hypothetical protein
MALARVQDVATVVASGNPLTSVLSFSSAVAAGSTLVVLIAQLGTSARTYVVSDNIHGTSGWTEAFKTDPTTGRDVAMWVRGNHNGGTVTITVTHSSSTSAFRATATEWSGFGATVSVDDTDSSEEAAADNSHVSGATGVTSTNECVAFCVGIPTSGSTGTVAGTGFTLIPNGATATGHLFQYKHFASGCTNEQGAWTHTGGASASQSGIVLLSGPAGAGGGGGGDYRGLMLMGIGS